MQVLAASPPEVQICNWAEEDREGLPAHFRGTLWPSGHGPRLQPDRVGAVAELISECFGTDSILRQHFAAGLDAHVATAMAMTGKADPADVTPEERELAKPCNFGLLYRMGNNGFFNYLRANFVPDITYSEACELRARFFAAYPEWRAGRTNTLGGAATLATRRP